VFLSVSTDKSLRGLVSGEMGAFLKNYLQTYVDINFLPCFGVGDLTPEVSQSILHIPCIRFTNLAAG